MTDDNKDWEKFTKSIKKIEEKPVIKAPTKEIKVKQRVETPDIFISKNDESLKIGSFDNVDRRTADRFRKGEMRVEATLDLHGYTEDAAFDEVFSFIKRSYTQGKRSIIIVTGKGTKKDDDVSFLSSKGVLRDRVPQWLNSAELRPFILSITHPDPKLGGSGALLILLRRQRE